MLELGIIGTILAILYFLIIKGYLWKLLILIFGFWGMYVFMSTQIPTSNSTFLTILNYNISWAYSISFLIVLMCVITTKVRNK